MENQDGTEGQKILKDLYWAWIQEDLAYLQFIKNENKVFHRLRERFSDNLELVELCREAIFDNDKLSRDLVERIRDVERRSKELC